MRSPGSVFARRWPRRSLRRCCRWRNTPRRRSGRRRRSHRSWPAWASGRRRSCPSGRRPTPRRFRQQPELQLLCTHYEMILDWQDESDLFISRTIPKIRKGFIRISQNYFVHFSSKNQHEQFMSSDICHMDVVIFL